MFYLEANYESSSTSLLVIGYIECLSFPNLHYWIHGILAEPCYSRFVVWPSFGSPLVLKS